VFVNEQIRGIIEKKFEKSFFICWIELDVTITRVFGGYDERRQVQLL
jgi:hypothetical protein